MGMFDFLGLNGMFGSDPSQGGMLSQQPPQQGLLSPPQITDPLTGSTPNQQKWMDALMAVSASLKDAGAFMQHQPEAAGFLSQYVQARNQRLQRQQQSAMYNQLLPSIIGTPTQTADVDTQTPGGVSYQGGILPSAQANSLAPFMKALPPDIGAKLALSMVTDQMSPKEGFTLGPGQARYSPTGTLLAGSTAGYKTLKPSDIGIPEGALPPDTIIQQAPTGEISIKKAGDVKSQAAVQQDLDAAAAKSTIPRQPEPLLTPAQVAQQTAIASAKSAAEKATDPAYSVLQKVKTGQPLTPDEQKLLQIEKPNAIATDDDAVTHTAQGIANYQLAPLSGQAMRSPYGQAVMSKVMTLNPDFQAQNYAKSVAGYRAFASGKQGDQMRFADNAIGHMNTALQLADALGNGNVPAFNSLAQSFAQNTGSAAPTNFDTAKQIIAGEVVKAITGAGGAVTDREQAQAAFSRASSPAQLKGAIQTAQTLLARQLQGLGRQYKNSTMRDDFSTLVSPESQALLAGGTAAPAATAIPNGWSVRVK